MNNLSIGQRLCVGFATVMALALAMTGISLWRLHETARETQQTLSVPLAKERLVSDWYATVYAGSRRTTAIAKSSDPSLADYFAEDAKGRSAKPRRRARVLHDVGIKLMRGTKT